MVVEIPGDATVGTVSTECHVLAPPGRVSEGTATVNVVAPDGGITLFRFSIFFMEARKGPGEPDRTNGLGVPVILIG